jgi:hypothetical protein
MLDPYQFYDLKIFLPFYRLTFHFAKNVN